MLQTTSPPSPPPTKMGNINMIKQIENALHRRLHLILIYFVSRWLIRLGRPLFCKLPFSCYRSLSSLGTAACKEVSPLCGSHGRAAFGNRCCKKKKNVFPCDSTEWLRCAAGSDCNVLCKKSVVQIVHLECCSVLTG